MPWPKGEPRSEETKERMRVAHAGREGRPQTKETKAKISAARHAREALKPPRVPKPPGRKCGWKWSNDQRAKLSRSRTGTKSSDSAKAARSAILKAKWASMSEEEKAVALAQLQLRSPDVIDPRRPRAKRPSGNCLRCGMWRKSLHREHIIPRCKGGSEEPDNIQWLCANCHEDKTREDMTGRPGPMKGRIHGEATREKMRIAAKRRTTG